MITANLRATRINAK